MTFDDGDAWNWQGEGGNGIPIIAAIQAEE
jgi:hypothetical protein